MENSNNKTFVKIKNEDIYILAQGMDRRLQRIELIMGGLGFVLGVVVVMLFAHLGVNIRPL